MDTFLHIGSYKSDTVYDENVQCMLKSCLFFWSMMIVSTALEAYVFVQPCCLIWFDEHELQLHVEASQGLLKLN
jgi:hypothetical protein